MQQLRELLANAEFVSFDTETTGIEKGSEIIGFSVCAEVGTAYYVILSEWNVADQKLNRLETLGGCEEFMAFLSTKSLIMHNAVFDCSMVLDNFGVDLMPGVHTDTMLLAHLLDENRSAALKELAVGIFGEDSKQEQIEMRASISKNGGLLTKEKYELYKGDSELIGRYGAKDAELTLRLFYELVPKLYEQNLQDFFYKDETMPLLRGPTYEMNRTGLRVDPDKLRKLKQQLEADCLEAKAFIYNEISPHIKEKYKGTSKANSFNIGSSSQLAWLLFFKLNQDFKSLTEEGRHLCKALNIKIPYYPAARRQFIDLVEAAKGQEYAQGNWNKKTQKRGKPKKVRDPWYYIACGKETLGMYANKYKWVASLLKYNKDLKLLNTYVAGIQSRMKYNVIRPSFLQHGTTSGRYSSRDPNFQNLPRDDKRVKACIVSRPGKVFVGADYSQLEPRVFASISQDARLLKCFKDGDDFYSVIGADVFNKIDCTLVKDDTSNSFPVKYKKLREIAKVIALATPYGTTPFQMSRAMGKTADECHEIIRNYLDNYPGVEQMMLKAHEQVKTNGVVYNLYGRPRRIPEAKKIPKHVNHGDPGTPYEMRNMMNLAVNHPIQSSGASIMNRAAIAITEVCKELGWVEVKIVMQVHDELILEVPESLAEDVALVLKHCMETTTFLPGVDLIAEPKIANNLADLK
jgi:DNA polymerase I